MLRPPERLFSYNLSRRCVVPSVYIMGKTIIRLAQAPRRWRLKLAESSQKVSNLSMHFILRIGRHSSQEGRVVLAFSSWKVALCVENNVQAGFRALLEAGGASISYFESVLLPIAHLAG